MLTSLGSKFIEVEIGVIASILTIILIFVARKIMVQALKNKIVIAKTIARTKNGTDFQYCLKWMNMSVFDIQNVLQYIQFYTPTDIVDGHMVFSDGIAEEHTIIPLVRAGRRPFRRHDSAPYRHVRPLYAKTDLSEYWEEKGYIELVVVGFYPFSSVPFRVSQKYNLKSVHDGVFDEYEELTVHAR